MTAYPDIDYESTKTVGAMVDQVRAAGLLEAANTFETVYWAWLRTVSAYVLAHPYVEKPEAPTMTPISALSVVDSTLKHWSPLVPGTPMVNDEAVRVAADDDEAWHREEDRRMRRDAGDDVFD